MLSQVHRDEGRLLSFRIGLPFNLLRKVSAAAVLVAVVLGFWIIGGWWAAIAPLSILVAGLVVHLLRKSARRLQAIFVFAILGLIAITWAQTPTVLEWGLVPRLL
jgi:hypothetical protein